LAGLRRGHPSVWRALQSKISADNRQSIGNRTASRRRPLLGFPIKALMRCDALRCDASDNCPAMHAIEHPALAASQRLLAEGSIAEDWKLGSNVLRICSVAIGH